MADYLLELLSPALYLWVAVVALAWSIIAFIQIGRNELKRVARREFKRALSRRHVGKADEIESGVVHAMVSAMKEKHFERIRDIGTDQLLEDYILDIDFKRRFYDRLSDELRGVDALTSKDAIAATLEAVSSWRHRPLKLSTEITEYLGTRSVKDRAAKWAMKYLETKDSYFEEKRGEMVDDVRAAIQAATERRAPVSWSR